MSQQQIMQLLRDPEISRILRQSMFQQEKEDSVVAYQTQKLEYDGSGGV